MIESTEPSAAHLPMNGARVGHRSARWPLLIGLVWASGVTVGTFALNRYENRPGIPASAPQQWPTDSQIARTAGRPTLVMFAHPRCPCTRASIGELAILMARAQGLVSTNVLFGTSTELPADWHETDLWQTAAAIPGVIAMEDRDGDEARRFGAATSGQVLLYDAEGRLQFSGGITDARGHSGDNVGRATVLALLANGGGVAPAESAVFGCQLVVDDASTEHVSECRQ